MSKTVFAIDAGTLLTPQTKISPARLIVDGSSIVEVGPLDRVPVPSMAQHIDATSYIVTPGFIDPHIHGCGGVDVMDGTFDALNHVSRILARHGTTSFVPTTVSSPPDTLTLACERLGALIPRTFDGAQPLGIHLEGPFISSLKRGTHRPANIVAPDPALLDRWVVASKASIRMITIAPELEGSEALAAHAASHGIRVAMGHSNASFEQAQAAVSRGVCYAVHTFNAMRAFSHRDPGIVGAVLTDDRVFAEIIADGIHVHPSVVRLFARVKGAARVVLVTDAVSAMDMPDGTYMLGPDAVTVVNGVCRDAEGRLAGSTLNQEVALRNFLEWTGFEVGDAIKGLTENPAQALGLKGKGVLAAGADADITILDSDLHVVKTFVAGKLVFG